MANQIFKDPYLFDFPGTDMPRREIEIERKLTEHIQNFLLELIRFNARFADFVPFACSWARTF